MDLYGSSDAWEMFVSDKKIKSYSFINESTLAIAFHETNDSLYLLAKAECCSESWFEKYKDDFDSIIGKEISDIHVTGGISGNLQPSGRQLEDYDQLVELTFAEESDDSSSSSSSDDSSSSGESDIISDEVDSKFQFVLRHSSNGYYSGWLDVKIISEQ